MTETNEEMNQRVNNSTHPEIDSVWHVSHVKRNAQRAMHTRK